MPIYRKTADSKCTLHSCSENQLYAVKYEIYWYVVKTYNIRKYMGGQKKVQPGISEH
jgi:hypothetical protein